MAGQVLLSPDGVTLVDHTGRPITGLGGGGAASFPLANTGAATTTDLLTSKVTSDANNRFIIDTDGTMWFGDGVSAPTYSFGYSSGTAGLVTTGGVKLGAAFIAGQTIVGSWSFASWLGNLAVYPANAAGIGMNVRGAASQTGNLTEWQDATIQPMTKVLANGDLHLLTHAGLNRWLKITGNSGSFHTKISADDAQLELNAGASTIVKTPYTGVTNLIVRGTASQTANLQEWQNSGGSVLSYVTAAGVIVGGGVSAIGNTVSSPTNYFPANASDRVSVVVRAAASQTANLQEWQDSTGALYLQVDPLGRIRAGTSALGLFGFGNNGDDILIQCRTNTSRSVNIGDNNGNAIYVQGSNLNIGLFGGNTFGGGVKVMHVANATTVPTTNPTGGGILYAEAGALKWRGSSGTVTVVAPA